MRRLPLRKSKKFTFSSFLLALLVLLLFLAKPELFQNESRTDDKSLYLVTKVHDGDSLHARPLSQPHVRPLKVRLYGIDAPEIAQNNGKQAQQWLSSKLLNQEVHLQIKETDKYGRSVAKVFLKEEEINLSLLQEGWAWYYASYAPREKAYQRAEEKAREQHKALWKEKNPTPPWQYRREKKAHP